MDRLIGLLVEMVRTFLPMIVWDMLVREINKAEARRQKAELDKKYVENKEQVRKDAEGRSARELLIDASKRGSEKP